MIMEILAPAGDMSSLKSAVAAGADAVYLGTKDFNARSKAENFDDEQLRLAVSYCHERNVKVYLTFNTLIKSGEIAAAVRAAVKAADAGVDAFIVQDIGLLGVLQKRLPDIPYHASTQTGVHNVYGALFAQRAGFDRIIFSREILPCDISEIKAQTELETEIFVHGAHCVSFSGNCYFSSAVSGFSGNRGKCMQLCRKKYTLTGNGKTRSGYMLSAKDMRLIDKLTELESLGIDSLKIEGRLRSAEYVGTVTEAYKNALKGKPYDITAVETVFNRGNFSTAYLSESRPDIIYPVQQNNIGSYVGTISSVVNGVVKTDKRISPCEGDGYKILRNGREIGGAICSHGQIKANCTARSGDVLRLTRSAIIAKNIKSKIDNCDKMRIEGNYTRILRKNHSTISDIALKGYELPQECTVLCLDEGCDVSLSKYADIVIFSPRDFSERCVSDYVGKIERPILLDMPVEARNGDINILKRLLDTDLFDGYVANNVYALELCKDKRILLGAQMNLLNDVIALPRIASYEAAFADDELIFAYGRQILMNLTHCPAKQLGYNCNNCKNVGEMTIKDETGNVFALRKKKLSFCYYEMINGKITDLFPKLSAQRHKRVLIDARNIDKKRILKVLREKYGVSFDENYETYGRWGKGVK